MYKLQKTEKIVSKLDFRSRQNKPPFDTIGIYLYDLENPKAYGLGGGTDYSNTQYYSSSLSMYRYIHEWYNTDRWLAELKVYFNFHTFFLRGGEKWEESYDINKLIDLVEGSFKVFIDNILPNFGNEIRTDRLKTKFWSEKEDGYIFTIDGIEEKLDSNCHQESTYTLIQASLYRNSKDELCYFRNSDKAIGKVPVKYEIVDKQVFIDKIRKDFIKVANRFLSQNYGTSLNVPEASDLIRMSREELLAIQGVYKNKIVWIDIIKK